jgi:amino acid transporter
MMWFAGFIGLIGFTSSQGCFLAAANSQTRIIFNGAREGLLPSFAARVARSTQVPYVAVAIYVGLTVLLVIVPYFTLKGNAVEIFTSEAGIGTVPILLVYLIATIALPIYKLRAQRATFNPVTNLIVPIIGAAVLAYGIYEFVQPNQPSPGNIFWIYILALLVFSVLATIIMMNRNPAAVERVGSITAD